MLFDAKTEGISGADRPNKYAGLIKKASKTVGIKGISRVDRPA